MKNCVDCNKEITKRATRCESCANRKKMLGRKLTLQAKINIGKGARKAQRAKYNSWIDCDICGIRFYRSRSMIVGNKKHYCSRKCMGIGITLRPPEEQPRYYGAKLTEEYKKKVKARATLNHYLRDKKIPRPSCQICGKKSEAHHFDYEKPLEVIFICRGHHRELHKNPEVAEAWKKTYWEAFRI